MARYMGLSLAAPPLGFAQTSQIIHNIASGPGHLYRDRATIERRAPRTAGPEGRGPPMAVLIIFVVGAVAGAVIAAMLVVCFRDPPGGAGVLADPPGAGPDQRGGPAGHRPVRPPAERCPAARGPAPGPVRLAAPARPARATGGGNRAGLQRGTSAPHHCRGMVRRRALPGTGAPGPAGPAPGRGPAGQPGNQWHRTLSSAPCQEVPGRPAARRAIPPPTRGRRRARPVSARCPAPTPPRRSG